MKTSPQKRQAGFTLVEIMIVVAIIGLLAAIAIPSFIRARATSQANACINNLRQVDWAINQWAVETGQAAGTAVGNINVLSSYIKLNSNNEVPQCPLGNTYILHHVGDDPQVECPNSDLTPPHVLP
ncbi:MAG TPA: prepilin-type N-terminal cleavage/methylation domain-containing protein [Verrucomicrobiae bacterium]|jgi:prepilin-type N-terminal cleavage/methylation domain-containing protein|nr:prepilin-type N-terminal cleavage/methylation domain-containing protein [Verrucomicrobiae bacterium]